MAQYRIIEAERRFDLVEHFLAAFDVHQHVMRFMDFLDREFELTATPILLAMYLQMRLQKCSLSGYTPFPEKWK